MLSGTTFMSTATYTCNAGYNRIGMISRTCGSDGVWFPAAPTCERKCDHAYLAGQLRNIIITTYKVNVTALAKRAHLTQKQIIEKQTALTEYFNSTEHSIWLGRACLI